MQQIKTVFVLCACFCLLSGFTIEKNTVVIVLPGNGTRLTSLPLAAKSLLIAQAASGPSLLFSNWLETKRWNSGASTLAMRRR